jgi:hypothetical protein
MIYNYILNLPCQTTRSGVKLKDVKNFGEIFGVTFQGILRVLNVD